MGTRFNNKHPTCLIIQFVLKISHLKGDIPGLLFNNPRYIVSENKGLFEDRHRNFQGIYAICELGTQIPKLILFLPDFVQLIQEQPAYLIYSLIRQKMLKGIKYMVIQNLISIGLGVFKMILCISPLPHHAVDYQCCLYCWKKSPQCLLKNEIR